MFDNEITVWSTLFIKLTASVYEAAAKKQKHTQQ